MTEVEEPRGSPGKENQELEHGELKDLNMGWPMSAES